jgi:putative ABC transport system permease protein
MISIPATLRISLRALWVNKMRSSLTMLGIIIGVASVITMLAVGNAASQKLSEQIANVGTNLLMVFPGSSTQGGVRMGMGSQSSLTWADAQAIEKEIDGVVAVAPMINKGAQVVYGNQNWSTGIYGTTSSMLTVRDCGLEAGRNFSDQDIRNANKVAIIGGTVADNLFGSIDPVGQIIRVQKVPFSVIGIMERKGQSPMGQDQDDVVYIPLTTAQKKIFGVTIPGMVRHIIVKAQSTEVLSELEKNVNELMRQRHRIGPGKEDDFSVRNLTQMLEMAQQFTKIITLLLGSIASVSLLVGGIGIMNIMLVSVTERTREIGIRMAVGAKASDIRLQFIIEAMTLSLIGGMAGILFGVVLSAVLAKLSGWPTLISMFSVILAVSFSGFVGIFFGFYPAYKASLLHPIDALRYE